MARLESTPARPIVSRSCSAAGASAASMMQCPGMREDARPSEGPQAAKLKRRRSQFTWRLAAPTLTARLKAFLVLAGPRAPRIRWTRRDAARGWQSVQIGAIPHLPGSQHRSGTIDPFRGEAFLPPDAGLRLARPAHDLDGAKTVRRQQHDLGPSGMLLRDVAVTDDRPQAAAIDGGVRPHEGLARRVQAEKIASWAL